MYESRVYSSSYRRFACIFLSSLLVLLILSITQFIPSVFGQERGIQFYIGGEPSIYPGDVRLDYYRYLQLVGLAPFDPLVIQPVSHETKQIIYDSGPWKDHFQGSFAGINSQTARWGIIPVSSSFVYNSAFPYGKNDGAMWAGKGLSSLINLGVYFVAGPLSIQLGPSYYLSQNLDFELVPVSSTGYSCFINPWHLTTIDLPQQFGPKAISRWDWGQSYIQLKYKGFAFSYGTENMWWGPALINPILMSNTAAGFPHFSLGTARPIKALAGHWELQMISGSLVESEWFDEDPDNNTRIFTGVIVDWQPRFIPGLVIGGARVFYQYPPEGNNRLNNFLMIFEPFFKEDLISASSPHGEDIKDQLVSVFIRWVFPESGLETYFELARNDHSWNLRDFMLEPEHSRAYTFGMQKVLPTTKIDLILSAEFTQLGPTTVMLVRSTGAYYYHGVRQGYTHKGQLLGAGIGSGAESENIGLSGMTSWGKWDFSFTRIRWENDAFFSWIIKDRPHAYWDHDVSFIATLSGMIFRNNFCFKGAFSYMREYNRYFIRNSDVTNLGFTFSIQRF